MVVKTVRGQVSKEKKVLLKKPLLKSVLKKQPSKKTSTVTKVEKVEKLAITTKNTQKKRTSIKLEHASQEKKTKVTIFDNTKKNNVSTESSVISRVSIYPAVRSPFRFPIPASSTMSVVAHTFGALFILFGTISLSVHTTQNPEIFGMRGVSNTATTIESNIVGTIDPTVSPNQNTEGLLITKPQPRVTVSATNPVSANIYISITVPSALEVKVLVSDMRTTQYYALGSAVSVDASTWKMYWDTTKYPDGEYKIKLLIKNQYGSYEYFDPTSITLENVTETAVNQTETASESTQSGTVESTISEVTETVSPTQPRFELRVSKENPVNGTVIFDVKIQKATVVKITLENTLNGSIYSVGQLSKKSDDYWSIAWNSTVVPDGTYVIRERALIDNIQYLDDTKRLVVKNVSGQTVLTPTATSSEVSIKPIVEDATILEPSINLSLSKQSPLKDFVDITVKTSPVDWIEIYAVPQKSLMKQFLGLAKKKSDTEWTFSWQTTNSPNGEYALYARAKSTYGFSEGGKKIVQVANTSMDEFTDEQEEKINTIHTIDNELIRATDSPDEAEGAGEDGAVPTERTYIEPVSTFMDTVELDDETKPELGLLLDGFRERLNSKLTELAKAKRQGDEEGLKKVEDEIETLKNEILSSLPAGIEQKELIEKINAYLTQTSFELRELTIKNEVILKERIGDSIMNDSDKDEISDYDEIKLYKTNPFSADSDNDGHNDNVEIIQGFNPLDDTAEKPVVYESPKEVGITREDILIVDSVKPIEKLTSEEAPKALISGKALPNSFVTLYIYSTPVVVTVKTDSEGNWNYVFDKELENGEHEVYIGITDNEGKIVAKSNPIPFVKTAEAYAGVPEQASQVAIASAEPSLINTDTLLAIASIIVLAFGIILIYLGLHLRKEEQPIEALPA